MYKLCFYVPATHVDIVKNAIFAAGAGRVANYDSCAWQVLGEGQFRPLAGSNPFIGAHDHIESVAEYKVETVCDDAYIVAVVAALKEAHPYEEPAYQVWKLEQF
jgi:structural hemagglutinin/hemolysin toxin protein RtxA